MEISVHAGLHKSGTTTVQHHFARAFGQRGRIWYPLLEGPHRVHHAPLIWPLLGVDDRSSHANPRLHEIVRTAADGGVERLIISSEELDRIGSAEVEPLAAAFGEHPVRVVFTVTHPRHRWASGWQEHVKHSLGAAPLPARQLLLDSACIGPRRLEQLVTIFPATTKTVLLVRRDRPDPTLVASVAEALGLPWATSDDEVVLNRAIGEEIVLLAHLNSLGVTSGLLTRRSIDTFQRARDAAAGARIDQFAEWEFDLPDELAEAAAAEVRFLRTATEHHGVHVTDRAGLLDSWETGGLPDWYLSVAAGSTGTGGIFQTGSAIRVHKLLAQRRASAYNELDEAIHARTLMARRLRVATEELRTERDSRSLRLATALRRTARPVADLLRTVRRVLRRLATSFTTSRPVT